MCDRGRDRNTDRNTDRNSDRNIANIRALIEEKKGFLPHYATQKVEVITDYDSVPYKRWWRGNPLSHRPMVAEREAGWRPQRNSCYKVQEPRVEVPYPKHCFESACSTVFPCYPDYVDKYAYKNTRDLLLNRSCIVQYR